jgi:cytochrome P450
MRGGAATCSAAGDPYHGEMTGTTGAQAPVVYEPYDFAFLDDPYPVYRRLRDETPVAYNSRLDVYALSRFADIWEAVHDPARFSSAQGISITTDTPSEPRQMIETDPPEHTALRKIVSRTFTPRRVAEMEPQIRELTTKWLDTVVERGECDLIEDFAAKLPMDVISTMLGVPASDHDMLRKLSDLMLEVEPGASGMTRDGARAIVEMGTYFYALIDEKRRSPDSGMITALTERDVEGEALTDEQIAGFCVLLAIAGNETTTKLIGHMAYHLDRHPDQRALVTADHGLAADVVEETTRFDPSSQMVARTLTTDVTMHGVTMEAGKKVALLIGAAARDEREFAEPDRYLVLRRPERTISFGHGAHVCLGAALARLEGRVALEEMLRRMPDWEVDAEGARRVHSVHVRGFSSLPVRFGPSPAR